MKFRIARHTDNFEPILRFYMDIIGLSLLGKFVNHNNYDGIFIGKENTGWHLEFTKSEHQAVHKFDDDDLLVFYPENLPEFNAIIDRFEKRNISNIKPKNPYWEHAGITYRDPDGHGVVIAYPMV